MSSEKLMLWTVVLEKTLKSPLGSKEIQPVYPKGNHSWIFMGRTDSEAETPILWPPDGKNWLIGKDPDAENDWRQEEKGITEDAMIGWHHQFPELAQTHVCRVSDVIQSCHPLSFPSPPAFSLFQHQGLFQWVSFSHQVMLSNCGVGQDSWESPGLQGDPTSPS